MRKIDLANPKTDVERLGRKFVKWISNRTWTVDAHAFDISDVTSWLTGSIYGDHEDSYILVDLWEKCGLIVKTNDDAVRWWMPKRKKHELRATGPKRSR